MESTKRKTRDTMNQVSTTAAKIHAMTALEFRIKAWDILTNNRQAGGGTRKGLRAARKRFRNLGGRFYLAQWSASREGPAYRHWGIIWPDDEFAPRQSDWIHYGVTPDHCAHELGNGDARKGWRIFHDPMT